MNFRNSGMSVWSAGETESASGLPAGARPVRRHDGAPLPHLVFFGDLLTEQKAVYVPLDRCR